MFRAILHSAIAIALSLHCALGADITVRGSSTPSNKQTLSLAGMRSDSSAQSREFMTVLKSDLMRSGWFVLVDAQSASVIVQGTVQGGSGISASANVNWINGMRQFGWQKTASANQVRDAAHNLCDAIVNKVVFTDEPGLRSMASSKIILVGRRGGSQSEIYVCDADGARLHQVTSDNKLCMSPTWIPSRNAFLYTSWYSGVPAIYKVNLDTKVREVVASYPGMNTGAVASPDGSIMALILSRSGGVDMYVQNMGSRKLTRITNSKGVNESSPSWSPDGENLVYVSDEGHVPRVHTMSVRSRQGRRAVYSSSIRDSFAPEWGPSGKIAFCGRSGRYRVYVMDAGSDPRTTTPLAVSPDDGADYEDPSWAPDGRHIVCTRTAGYRRSLVVLDTLGEPLQQLLNVSGEWYLPHWSKSTSTGF